MSFEVSNNIAYIKGDNTKGASYGQSAASNYAGYIQSLGSPLAPIDKDVFSKGNIGAMNYETQKIEKQELTPVNFLLRYAPKKGFFARLFTGKLDKQALLGFSAETMNGKMAKSVEEFDKDLNEAFKDTGAKLTSKAFDVNNDGMIDISESAVSTVLADVLSKSEDSGTIKASDINLKQADGSYTNQGENRMMAFCNEKNVEEAKGIVKNIHSQLKLDKALNTFQG